MASKGKLFEEDFKKSIPSDVFYQRLKDDTSGFKGVNNICDYIIYRHPSLFLFELKSHKGKSIPFDALRVNQIEGLYKASYIRGVKAGFIFNFRDSEETYFVPAKEVYDFICSGCRKSFPISWCKDNGISLGSIKKRTRFTYRVDELLDYTLGGLFYDR